MTAQIQIAGRPIGHGHPVYVIAEVSANHHQDFEQAVELVRAAKAAGADAVKLQTYTPETITIASDGDLFRIGAGTLWDGHTLHDLYEEAHTPWDWQPKLQQVARDVGVDLFSSPFDGTAVEFLERLNVPAYKIASFELVDIGLIERVARTGKPIILSTGMATVDEIAEALDAARRVGATEIALLKCTSAYPAAPEEMHLGAIPALARRFELPVGLSDHTLSPEVPVAAVALGAVIVEKHITLSRALGGPDSAFSLEPQEFAAMVRSVRTTQQAIGRAEIGPSPRESASRILRRSLFVVQDTRRGETFTGANVRSIRPGHGLHTRCLPEVIGKRAACDIDRGTPLRWDLVAS